MGEPQWNVGADRAIGAGHPTCVVAEIGQNHNGDMAVAEQLVDIAAWSGADAVKVVKRDIPSELSQQAHARPYQGPHSFGSTYGEHRRHLELNRAQMLVLKQRAEEHGLLFFATACDLPSLETVVQIGADALKIASRDLTNLPLVEAVAVRGLPALLSTGMSTWDEIDVAVAEFRRYGTRFAMLQCTSLYPTPLRHAHLRSMITLAQRYQVPVGFSDHTRGTLLAPVAVGMGAAVIEKHLTMDRRMRGTDHSCSLEPEEFRKLVQHVRQVEDGLGSGDMPVPDQVAKVRSKLGRSLVANQNLAAGTQLDEPMLSLKCPGDGLSWLDRGQVVGRHLRRDVAADHVLGEEDFV